MRHLRKNEILARMKEVSKLKNSSDKTPFTGMATICNYVLWKKDKWYQKQLAEYNALVLGYEQKLGSGGVTLEQLQERLLKKAEIKIDHVPYTEKDITVSQKKSFMYEMEKRVVEAKNVINEMSARYFLIHFNALMDMGYGKKRLERNRDWINEQLAEVTTVDDHRIMDLHRELHEEAGIYIEMPKVV